MSSKTILLVEDNPDDQVLTIRALKKNNILNEVQVAQDGVEAVEYLTCTGAFTGRTGGLPQLVLLDLKLPKLDGLGVLRKVRQDPKLRHVPVVVLTSSKEERDIIESYQLGANSYVQKPVDFGQFLDAVRQLGLY